MSQRRLWRGEIAFAKFVFDFDAKFVALRRFLEWRIELDHDWSLRPGAYGRGLERLLPADIWSQQVDEASARTSKASASSLHGPLGSSGSRDHSCQEPT